MSNKLIVKKSTLSFPDFFPPPEPKFLTGEPVYKNKQFLIDDIPYQNYKTAISFLGLPTGFTNEIINNLFYNLSIEISEIILAHDISNIQACRESMKKLLLKMFPYTSIIERDGKITKSSKKSILADSSEPA